MTTIITSDVMPDAILPLYQAIPEFTAPFTLADIQQRLDGHRVVAMIAYYDGKPAGFKLGYDLSESLFYSWLGGVLPAYRRGGVAQDLLNAQEQRVRSERYTRLQVKTRNCYPGMLQLLIKNGYQIIELEKKGERKDYRLRLEKAL